MTHRNAKVFEEFSESFGENIDAVQNQSEKTVTEIPWHSR